MPAKATANLQRDTLRKLQQRKGTSDKAKQLAALRIAYSEDHKLLTGYVNSLVHVNRIYPRHLPTQASFRWSTYNPPITNWPRACINPECVQAEHEWTFGVCWSIRDILLADSDEVLVVWDHDNIEGRIHDLIVNDQQALMAHKSGQDLHTITCCNIFNYHLPPNLNNPHTYCECDTVQEANKCKVDTVPVCVHCQWRALYNWQGKDTKQRVLAKNFNHGSKYTKTWRFVYTMPGVEQYGVTRDQLGKLARAYIESKEEAWAAKLAIMESIRRARMARTLYGARRTFWDSSEETAREGFSHMISGTVSDYNNHTLILLEQMLGDSCRLLHNAHDGDKIAIKRDSVPSTGELLSIIQRSVEYKGREIELTAGVKVYE